MNAAEGCGRWGPAPVTLASYKHKGKSHGGLLDFQGNLKRSLFPAYGPDFAGVGASQPYAAMMQFGGTKARFPHLWGDIPARPFLGIGEEDVDVIQEIVAEWFQNAALAGK